LSDRRAAPVKPREFEPIEDPVEARKLLKEGSRLNASASIWTKEQKLSINTSLSVFDEADQVLYAATPREIDPAWFMDQLVAIGSHDCFFSVSLSRANIFFKARYLGHDAAGFRFRTPDAVFKVQRRKDMRLLIPFGHTVRVEMQDPSFPEQKLSKKIFDISASGLSFIVSDTEGPVFQTGVILKNIVFSIGSRRIVTDAEVRHAKSQAADSSHPGVKVGVLFKNIRPSDSQWIAAYVFEESRKIMIRFM
jgi:hypothetical protein